jgi:hypothetical protein
LSKQFKPPIRKVTAEFLKTAADKTTIQPFLIPTDYPIMNKAYHDGLGDLQSPGSPADVQLFGSGQKVSIVP